MIILLFILRPKPDTHFAGLSVIPDTAGDGGNFHFLLGRGLIAVEGALPAGFVDGVTVAADNRHTTEQVGAIFVGEVAGNILRIQGDAVEDDSVLVDAFQAVDDRPSLDSQAALGSRTDGLAKTGRIGIPNPYSTTSALCHSRRIAR